MVVQKPNSIATSATDLSRVVEERCCCSTSNHFAECFLFPFMGAEFLFLVSKVSLRVALAVACCCHGHSIAAINIKNDFIPGGWAYNPPPNRNAGKCWCDLFVAWVTNIYTQKKKIEWVMGCWCHIWLRWWWWCVNAYFRHVLATLLWFNAQEAGDFEWQLVGWVKWLKK